MLQTAPQRSNYLEIERCLDVGIFPKMVATRHHTSGIVNHLGPSAELPVADLPTLQNVLKQCQLLREPHSFLKTYGSFAMAADVLPLFLEVWKRANAKLVALPIRISDDSLIGKVERQW